MLSPRYDDPLYMFRTFMPEECEEDGEGYPYLWNELSRVIRAERLYRCDECGFAYLEKQEILTVHHRNSNKSDCRRENLVVRCWLHHSVDHTPGPGERVHRCKFCGRCQIGIVRLKRHLRGIHKPYELKIPPLQLDRPPSSYHNRSGALKRIQNTRYWWD